MKELVAEARLARDRELGPNAAPAFRLSDVKRRQVRALPLMLLILAAWVASQFVVIGWVRPLMVTRSDWYGLLLILYLVVSAAVMSYAFIRVYRWIGLRCPHCGATFIHIGLKEPGKDPARSAEDDRRCGRCHAVIIDLDA
jgi:hypothetical protein